MIMRDFFEMNEIIPGELWFEIARRDFSVWRALTKTVKAFWMYVQKIGRERIVEKLFGRTIISERGHAMWFIDYTRYRFGGLPFWIDIDDLICWYRGNRSAGRNLLSVNNACMKVTKPSHGVREMWCYYDGRYIIGDMSHNSDNSSTLSVRTKISLQEIYFQFGAHRYAVQTIDNDGTLRYFDFTELRDQNLPRFLDHNGSLLYYFEF